MKRPLSVLVMAGILGGTVFAFAAHRAYHWTYYQGETWVLRTYVPFAGEVYDCERARRCAQKVLGTSDVYCAPQGEWIEVPPTGQGQLHEVTCK